ncbi:phosphate ABC transporter permease subunit PstC, partial [Mycobacterium kansasii]
KITVLSSVMALILAVPVAVGIATFLVQYVPQRLSRPLSAVIDLLAAVPSIIYGLWGIFVLAPFLVPLQRWLNENLGWFFLFKTGNVELSL